MYPQNCEESLETASLYNPIKIFKKSPKFLILDIRITKLGCKIYVRNFKKIIRDLSPAFADKFIPVLLELGLVLGLILSLLSSYLYYTVRD